MGRKGFTGLAALTAVLAACSTGAPQLAEAPSPALAAEAVPGQLLVQYRSNVSPASVGALEARLGVQRIETVAVTETGRLELVRVRSGGSVEATVAALSAEPGVRFAEPNYVYRTPEPENLEAQASSNDPYFTNGSLWGMYGDASSPRNVYGSGAAEAWARGNTGSRSVYVGVIDEGVQYNHPELDANMWTNPFDPVDGRDNDGNGYVDDVRGWDFASNNSSVYDGGTRGRSDDHGTHVAGTIGAESNTSGVAGVNWNVTMISGKFLGASGGTSANAVRAVRYFTDLKRRHGLNIVATNNSWGGGGYSQALFDAIEDANRASILFIAAAGNGGSDGVGDNNDSAPHYPSSYTNANIIAVAAITSSGAKSGFSNYGRTSVDIGAPGSGIISTTAYNGFSNYNGTSMATPHVAGAAALYAASHPGATAAQIKAAILGAAVPTPSLSGITTTGGRLNVDGF